MTPTQTTTRNATYAADDALLCMSDGTTRTSYTYSARGALSSKMEMTTSANCAATPTCAEYSCAETTYDYDAMGNLTAVVLPDNTLIEYKSDAAGRRVAKKVNGTLVKRWLWDGQLRPIAELDPDGSVTSLFVYADGVNSPEYMIRPGVEDTYYTFVKDALGSVRRVLDADGKVIQAISYDAWGVPAVTKGDLDFQPFGFAGGLFDADTGLVRFGARDYDAGVGRWTAKDPIRFGGNDVVLYVYAGNDPVNRVDFSGLDYINVTATYGKGWAVSMGFVIDLSTGGFHFFGGVGLGVGFSIMASFDADDSVTTGRVIQAGMCMGYGPGAGVTAGIDSSGAPYDDIGIAIVGAGFKFGSSVSVIGGVISEPLFSVGPGPGLPVPIIP